MAKDIKLSLDNATLLAVLQVALDTAVQQKDAALSHHDLVAQGLVAPDGSPDLSVLMQNKEMAETIEKYLKSADQSIDKMIKIARLLADVMLRSRLVSPRKRKKTTDATQFRTYRPSCHWTAR